MSQTLEASFSMLNVKVYDIKIGKAQQQNYYRSMTEKEKNQGATKAQAKSRPQPD